MSRSYIQLSINGKLHQITGQNAFLPLSDLLRYELGLTGTKIVCAEGDCGACTVLYRRANSAGDQFYSLNSCIAPTFLLDGCHVLTVEGLGRGDKLCEVQDSMVRNFGGQCGFCTPGFVMSIANMYEHKTDPSEQNVKNYLTGNLCRCTGYTPIIQAALDVNPQKIRPLHETCDFQVVQKSMQENFQIPIQIGEGEKEIFAPTTLAMAADYKKRHPQVRIFSGATDLGVQINKGKDPGKHLMSFHLLKDLYEIQQQGEWVRVGARVTLDHLQKFVSQSAPEFAEFLNIFASPQIKNAATLIGNVANGSPIADTTPYLLTADAVVELMSTDGVRTVTLNEFIRGYKSFDLYEHEFITHIRFRVFAADSVRVGIYKISQRRDLDISCVNSSFVFSMKGKNIEEARIALGGVGPRALRLTTLEKDLVGCAVNEELIRRAQKSIDESISPISDMRGSSEFRRRMCRELFSRYVQEQLI